MIVALWLIRAIAGQIVGIVVYRSASDEVIAEWTQVAIPGLVALAKVFLLALVVVPLVFVAVHVHRRWSESPSRHLGGVSPAQALPAPQPTHTTAAGFPNLAGSVAPVPPSGAEVAGRGRLSPNPGAEVARRIGAASHSAVESMRQASTVARANPPSALVLTDDREQSGPRATVAADIGYPLCDLHLYSAPAGSRRGCRGERDRGFDDFLSKHGHGGIDLIAARHPLCGPERREDGRAWTDAGGAGPDDDEPKTAITTAATGGHTPAGDAS